MILFKQDWDLYPSATPHFETKNQSFLDMADLFGKMGVDNNLFHLALFQEDLRYVDPYDPELSQELRNKVTIECRFNPWYYFREVVRLPAGAGTTHFIANRGNISLIWSFFNHIDYLLIQPRQTGKSGSTDCISVNLMYFSMSGGKITLITKDDGLRKANIARLKGIRDELPKYTWEHNVNDADNQTELSYGLLNNQYITAVAQKSEAAALNVGRGFSSQVQQIDEGPFCSNIDITFGAALAAGTKVREFARANGQPYGNIFTTTAGKKDTKEGAFFYKLMMEGTPFDESLYDCRDEADLLAKLNMLCTGDGAPLINGTWSYSQLGLTKEWLYTAVTNARVSGDDADRDFFNVWTSGSLSSPLSVELNKLIAESEIPFDHREWIGDYAVDWFIPEADKARYMEEGTFVMGLDTSNAIGRDAIAMVIVDIRDLSVVAGSLVRETNLLLYGEFISNLMIKYRKITLIIENKSSAQTMIDQMLISLPKAGQDPLKRIFSMYVEESNGNKEYQQIINTPTSMRGSGFYQSGELRRKIGFITNAERRNTLYREILPEAAKIAHAGVRWARLSSEIRGLVVKDGRIDHKTSGHDDTVIAWLMCFWFILRGSRLDHYGISTADIRSRLSSRDNSAESRMKNIERQKQSKFRAELDDLVEKIREETNSFLVARMEHRMAFLNSQIRAMGGESISLDAVLNEAKEERRRNRIKRSPIGDRTTYLQ